MSAPCRLATAKVVQLVSVECQHHAGWQLPRWVSARQIEVGRGLQVNIWQGGSASRYKYSSCGWVGGGGLNTKRCHVVQACATWSIMVPCLATWCSVLPRGVSHCAMPVLPVASLPCTVLYFHMVSELHNLILQEIRIFANCIGPL